MLMASICTCMMALYTHVLVLYPCHDGRYRAYAMPCPGPVWFDKAVFEFRLLSPPKKMSWICLKQETSF